MILYVIFGAAAAFGVLCAIWVVLGSLIPGSRGCRVTVSCPAGEEMAVIRRYLWLRELGFTRSGLTVLHSALPPARQQAIRQRHPYIEFSTKEQEELDGAGIGDPTGHHCGGGLSEL